MADKAGIPVSEFLSRWSSQEITELIAFYGLEAETAKDQTEKAKLKASMRKH